jgi:Integral peroxisomal membrane peroxin
MICIQPCGFRYFLPILLVSAVAFNRWRPSYFSRSSPIVTEKSLQHTISDLTTIHALIPHPFAPSTTSIPLITFLRIALLSYPPYLLLTYFVSLRILLGVSGSIVLTCRAPWSQTTRHILWKSAYIRWSFYHLASYITGHPLPPKTLFIQAHSSTSSGPVNSVRFLFTIYENQRWWMGLDWTAALLPAERPSWCSAAQLPVSPPNAFSLPPPAVSYLPADTKEKDRKAGKRVKRTARWSWEEGEWRVMIRKDGIGGVSRVERPLPSDDNSSGQSSGAASRIFKGVGKRRESSDSAGVGAGTGGKPAGNADEEPFEGGDEEDGLVVTDPDGWVYGDNKWEGGSAKGGLGKVNDLFIPNASKAAKMSFFPMLTRLFVIYSIHATGDGRA